MKGDLRVNFARGFGPIPRVVDTEQEGAWGSIRDRRLIRVGDGSRFVEEQLTTDEPHSCSYRLIDFTGPQSWNFEAARDGTRVTWAWTVNPSTAAAALMPIVAAFWRGYSGRALRVIHDEVQRSTG